MVPSYKLKDKLKTINLELKGRRTSGKPGKTGVRLVSVALCVYAHTQECM